MKEPFLAFIEEHQLWSPHQRILVAISGGRDSIVLAHLLRENNFKIGFAHVNYHLRGEASDQDEYFVQQLAEDWDVELHVHHEDLSGEEGNIQTRARSVRYEFFNRVCEDYEYDVIATAHHFDDRVESLLLNLMRGSGMHGLKGIPAKRDNVIRPLLWTTRTEIDAYIKTHQLSFREDESNASLAYRRNQIRHEVMPLLHAMDPHLTEKLQTSLKWLSQDIGAMDEVVKSFIHQKGQSVEINLKDLPRATGDTWLYHCLRSFGFTRAESKQLWETSSSGKHVIHGDWLAQKQGTFITIVKQTSREGFETLLERNSEGVDTALGKIKARHVTQSKVEFDPENLRVYLKIEDREWPLKVRSMLDDDLYQPLGLNYSVNLKKFIQEKGASHGDWLQKLGIETADGALCWVVGLPVNEEFKIRENDTEILCLYFDRNGD